MRVLAGDIGGTKTWLQIAEFSGQARQGRVIYEERYDSQAYPDFSQMLEEFLSNAPGLTLNLPEKACFGVAGPVSQTPTGQSSKLTNLPWQLDTQALADELSISKVQLINDFQAIGYGIEALQSEDLVTLQTGQAQVSAPRLVIGPGTGLGVGLLTWQSDHYAALPSQGGHMDFAPVDIQQIALLDYLLKSFGHAPWESVVSGSGLTHLYEFLCTQHPGQGKLSLQQDLHDLPARITEAAEKGDDVLAIQAVELFVSLCGAFAGNLALASLPYGGVYVAGGIAPKLIERFKDGMFLRAFNTKSSMSSLLMNMPVRVIMNPKVGLMGAALVAHRL